MDYVKFQNLKRQAVRNGLAAYIVGATYYLKGKEEPKNFQKAFIWFEHGSKSNENKECFYGLGLCYYYGVGVEHNQEQALINFEKSYNLGYELAAQYLSNKRKG